MGSHRNFSIEFVSFFELYIGYGTIWQIGGVGVDDGAKISHQE
jgi:hypothetical protein